MKRQTNISKRDKNLLAILIAVIIGFLGYIYIINPQMLIGTELKYQSGELQTEIQQSKDVVNKLSSLKDDEKAKKEELLEKYQIFFYDLNQKGILYKLDTLMQEAGLPITAYSLENLQISVIPIEINEYSPPKYPLLEQATITNPDLVKDQEDSENKGPEQEEGMDSAVPVMNIVLELKGAGYPSVINFIKRVENINKAIQMKSLDLSKEEGSLSGQISLSFYSMPKLDESEKDYLEFLPNAAIGKDNPF